MVLCPFVQTSFVWYNKLLAIAIYRWKLLEFAELKRSSISFFDIEKPESALSRLSRATTRAARVSFDQFGAELNDSHFISISACRV